MRRTRAGGQRPRGASIMHWDSELALTWAVRLGLLAVLVAVCIHDCRSRRIPNAWVAAGSVIALAWHALMPAGSGLFDRYDPGALGMAASLAGAAAAFGVFLLLHVARVMGAGDVKLMAMLGAVFGLGGVAALTVLVFGVGGLLVALRIANRERRRLVVANLQVIVFGRLAAVLGQAGPRFDPKTDTADRLPYALAICGGACVLALLQLFGMASWS